MSGSNHSDSSSSNGSAGAKHLLDFVRDSREQLQLSAGSVLYQEGQACRGAYFIEEGEVSLSISSGERQIRIGAAKAGNLLGISSIVSDANYQCSAQATVESKLTFVPAAEMREYLRHHAELCLLAVEHLGAELMNLSEKAIRPLRAKGRHGKA